MRLALLPAATYVLPAKAQRPDAVARMATQLDSVAPEWLTRFHVPGTAVVRRDTVLLLRGWGSPVAGETSPSDRDGSRSATGH